MPIKITRRKTSTVFYSKMDLLKSNYRCDFDFKKKQQKANVKLVFIGNLILSHPFLKHFRRCLQTSGFIDVKQRAGCLSYQEDKFGYRSELARTLTHSNIMPWSPAQKAIDSFSSDCIVRYFTDHFLTVESQEKCDAKELHLVQTLTRFTYDCMIKDRLALLPILVTMAKVSRVSANYFIYLN